MTWDRRKRLLYGRLDRCPLCGSEWNPAVSMNGVVPDRPMFYKCANKDCSGWYWDFTPLPFQRQVLSDNHLFVANFGAYGSGKTRTSITQVMKHVLITPNGKTLIGSNFASQYKNTFQAEFEELFPNDFIVKRSAQYDYYDLYNGHRIQYRMFDDPERLRSYNVSMFVIVEASECRPEAFTQLRTRLRNTAAAVQLEDGNGNPVFKDVNGEKVPVMTKGWRKGLVESNPSSGWIKDDVLMRAEKVISFGDVLDLSLLQRAEDAYIPDLSVVLTATSANPYLPADYIRQISAGKPAHWIARYVHASFSYTEARVFPEIEKTFSTQTFEIPKTWKRIASLDWGLVDDSAFLFGAIDPDTGIVWVYREVRTNEKSISQLADIFKEASKDVPIGGWYTTPLIDPVSGGNRNAEKRTIMDMFAENGIVFQPGARQHKVRIAQISTYALLGRLRIMQPRCPTLCEELVGYLYKKDTRVSTGYSETPEDGNDHSITSLGFMMSGLPHNPNMIIHDKNDGKTVDSGYGAGYNYGSFALETGDFSEWGEDAANAGGDNLWLPKF